MAYLLATANKRVKIALTQAVFMWLASAVLLIYASGLIIFFCNILHGGDLDVKTFILMNVVLYFLQVAVGGICFFASCISNDTKLYFTIGAGIYIFSKGNLPL